MGQNFTKQWCSSVRLECSCHFRLDVLRQCVLRRPILLYIIYLYIYLNFSEIYICSDPSRHPSSLEALLNIVFNDPLHFHAQPNHPIKLLEGSTMKPSRKRTHGLPKRNALPTLWDPEPYALCTEKKRVMHPNGTHCTPKWNALRTGMKYAAHPRKATSWNAPRMENETLGQPCETPEPNRTRCAESETNRTRCAESETNRTTYPLETRGTKKSYLSNLSSLHLQLACPTSWWEKPAHATRKNQNQNRPLLTERPIPGATPEREGRVGKLFQGKKELGPCRWENHEWRKTAQARW